MISFLFKIRVGFPLEAMTSEMILMVSGGNNKTSSHCQGSCTMEVLAAPGLSKIVWSIGDRVLPQCNPQTLARPHSEGVY